MASAIASSSTRLSPCDRYPAGSSARSASPVSASAASAGLLSAASRAAPASAGSLGSPASRISACTTLSASSALFDSSVAVWTAASRRFHSPINARTRATVGSDGYPQLSQIWFLHDDGELKTSLNDSRLKTRNLKARPQCNLLILDVSNPYRYLAVKGDARVEPDPDYEFAEKLGAKYGGANLREHDGPGEGRVIVTIEPTVPRDAINAASMIHSIVEFRAKNQNARYTA